MLRKDKYKIIKEDRESKDGYLVVEDNKKLFCFFHDGKDEISENYYYLTNAELEEWSIKYKDIKEINLSLLPNKVSFWMSLYDDEITKMDNTLLNDIPYPFNDWITFTKQNNQFSVVFSSIEPSYDSDNGNKWLKKWSPDFYFCEMAKQAELSGYKGKIVTDGHLFASGTCLIEITDDKSNKIEDSLKSTIPCLLDIITKTEVTLTGFSKIHDVLLTWNNNKNNPSEEYWQNFLTNHSWVISQIFSLPLILFNGRAFIGGKGLQNKDGKIIDFLFKNKLTQNITLIEIKTPNTPLVSGRYRNKVNSISKDLSGAINQLLQYRDVCQKDYYIRSNYTAENYKLFNPKCLLIIGSIMSLNDEERTSFELFRNELKSIEIITFDEMFDKLNLLLELS